jgi:hypothetical protein
LGWRHTTSEQAGAYLRENTEANVYPETIVCVVFFADFVSKKYHTERYGAAPQAHCCGLQPQRRHVI